MQNKKSKEKQAAGAGREAIANGKPKWVAPTSYFIFLCYAFVFGIHAHMFILALVYT